MKYEYRTFRKNAKGKWEQLSKKTPTIWTFGAKTVKRVLEKRHGVIQSFGWGRYYGVECVTKLRKGGDVKGTEGFVLYFDYTVDGHCGPLSIGKKGARARYREAVVKA